MAARHPSCSPVAGFGPLGHTYNMPASPGTNWLRIDSGEKSHTVIFTSRDWKLLLREPRIPMGRHWLRSFGFDHCGSVAGGLVIGYATAGDRQTMLDDSRSLLPQVIAFSNDPNPPTYFHGSIRPRKPPRKHVPVWPSVLPALIEFLSGIDEPKVRIFNHHR